MKPAHALFALAVLTVSLTMTVSLPLVISHEGPSSESIPGPSILLNNHNMPKEVIISPNHNLTLGIILPPNTQLTAISVVSSNPLIEELILNSIPTLPLLVFEAATTHSTTLKIPPVIPSGKASLDFTLSFRTGFEEGETHQNTALRFANGSFALRMASLLLTSQTAAELLSQLSSASVQTSGPHPTYNDITPEDLYALGISPDKFFSSRKLLSDSETLREKRLIPEADATLAASKQHLPVIIELSNTKSHPRTGELLVKTPRIKSYLSGPIKPDLHLTATSYLLTFQGKNISKTKLYATVHSPSDTGISRVNTILFIPKEAATHSTNITSTPQAVTIEQDPILSWTRKHIPAGTTMRYTLTFDGDHTNVEYLAGASAHKPSILSRTIYLLTNLFLI